MMRLKAASMVSVRLFGTAQAKKSVVSRMNEKRIPFGIILFDSIRILLFFI